MQVPGTRANIMRKLRKIIKRIKNKMLHVPSGHIQCVAVQDGFQVIPNKSEKNGFKASDLNSEAFLYAYNTATGSYCNKLGIKVRMPVITKKDIRDLLRETSVQGLHDKVRICISLNNKRSCHWLVLGDECKNAKARIQAYITENDQIITDAHLCTYLTRSGTFSIARASRVFPMQETTALLPIEAIQESGVMLLDIEQEDPVVEVSIGLFDRKSKHFMALRNGKRTVSIAEIGNLYQTAKGYLASERPVLCVLLWENKPVVKCLRLNDFHSKSLENMYDALILPLQTTGEDRTEMTAVFLNQKGRMVVQNISETEARYYGLYSKRNEIPEATDTELFKVIDKDTFDNDADVFFDVVRKYSHALQDRRDADEEVRYWMQKRILSNLDAMIQSACKLKTMYGSQAVASEEDWEVFRGLMKQIDDEIIRQANITRYSKWFLYGLKYNNQYRVEEGTIVPSFYYGNEQMEHPGRMTLQLDIMELQDDCLTVEGYYRAPEAIIEKKPEILVYANEEMIGYKPKERDSDRWLFGKPYSACKAFQVKIPTPQNETLKIRFKILLDGQEYPCRSLGYGSLSPVGNETRYGYFYQNGYMLKADRKKLTYIKCSENACRKQEDKLLEEIRQKLPDRYQDIIDLRKYYWASQKEPKEKQKWLLIDRADRADDNAEALFKYVTSHLADKIDATFIISQESADFERMSQYGRVIDFGSQDHLKTFLTSDYVLSSHMSPSSLNPFNQDMGFVRDLIGQRRFVLLQHGVTHNDNGYTFSRYSHNYYGIVTSAKREQEYLCLPWLHNNPDSIWLTGMPRFDYLRDDHRKIITIMPTWRRFLTIRCFNEEQKTMVWEVADIFKQSEYYKFYNSLINDDGLAETARQHGYQIHLMLHPQFLKTGHLFDNHHPDVVTICDYEKNYQEVYAESALIITDYTSAVFDFAYMRKPVLYCQFDKEAFYRGHTVRPGYFEHERDGFGEVATNLTDTLALLQEYIEHDCRLKEKYRKRIDGFFGFSDRNCCKRICDRILSAL